MDQRLVHHKRAMVCAIERQGYEPSEALLTVSVDPGCQRSDGGPKWADLEGAERYDTWAVESLLTGIRSFDRGEPRMAMRCLLQAAEYTAKGTGFRVDTRDAYEALSQAIQSLLPDRWSSHG